ncbi:MAG: TonB-dependent receptor [Kiritimatiellia bacterium]
MNRRKLVVACAATGVLGVCAETNTNAVAVAELPPVTIEASRLDKTALEIPAPVQVITRPEIAQSGAKDVVDLLAKKTSSLNLIRTGAGNPALAQVAMRGWGENGFGRVLVMVDGQRLNFADMSAPLLSQIDLGSIDRIEILQGSQCVLQGDAASAGAINIVTDPADYDTHGRIETYGGSWETFGARAAFRGGDAAAGVKYWAHGAWEHSEGYRSNNGWQTWNLGGGLRKDWENGSYLRVSTSYNDSDYELPGYLGAAEWKHHRTRTHSPADTYRRTTYGLNATFEGVVHADNRLRLNATASRSKMHTRSYFTGVYEDYNPATWLPQQVSYSDDYRMTYDLYSYELTPQWINTTPLGGLDNELIVGAMFRYDRLHGDNRDSYRAWPDFWDANGVTRTKYAYERQSMGFFAQDTLHVTEWLAAEVGGRYQRTWSKNTVLTDEKRIADTYAADAALLFTPVENAKAYIRFARFFRNPFLDENPYRNYRAQEILRPETGWTVDVGADYTFMEEFNVYGDIFITKTKHEILYDKFVWNNNVNAPCDILREGFTLGGRWERDKVAGVNISYTFVDAEFDGGAYDGNDVPMTARSTLLVNGRVWLWDACFVHGGYRYLSTRRAYSDFGNEGSRLAAYGVFHLGAQYAPNYECLKGLRIGFSIDNLLDRRYADCATRSAAGYEVYYPAAGRSFMLTLAWEF